MTGRKAFLRNEAIGIAAIDYVRRRVSSFRLLYVMIILTHGRRKIVRFDRGSKGKNEVNDEAVHPRS